MFRNYLKIAWRNLRRKPVFPTINMLGLSIGLAGFVVLLIFMNYEKSYDTWHPDLEKVYKIGMENDGRILWNGKAPAPLAAYLRESYPGVEAGTRISTTGTSDFEVVVEANNKREYQRGVIEADSLFFTVFPYEFIYGDRRTALLTPGAVVLEKRVAERYFGHTNPVGQPISFHGGRIKGTVSGVIQPPSTPSVLDARIVIRSPYENDNNHWQNFSFETYIKFHTHGIEVEQVASDVNSLYASVFSGNELAATDGSTQQAAFTYFAENLTELHVSPKSGDGNFTTMTILLLLATFLIIAGAVNFSNLAAADAYRRVGEVGVRKVLGSGKFQLVGQFMTEVGIQVLVAVALSIVFVALLLPWFQNQFSVTLSFFQPGIGLFYLQLGICVLLIIFIAGCYPALVFSRLNAVNALKGGSVKIGREGLGSILTIFQLTLSAFFIISSLVVFKQIKFMQLRDKGFSDEQVIRIQATMATRDRHFEEARQRLLAIPGVVEVAKTTAVPGDAFMDTSSVSLQWNDKILSMNEVKVSRDYFRVIGAELVKGRWFDGRYADEHTRSAVINEAAARQMTIDNPVGEIVRFPYCDTVNVQIIGVVKDFNVRGLHVPVQPAIFNIGNFACSFRSGGAILVKMETENPEKTVAAITDRWKEIEPEFPIRYVFLDENYQKYYAEYLRLQQIVFYFTIVAIFVAITGLLAMSVFHVREKTRELGIRKILGADIKDLVNLTSKRFLIQVLLAIVLAVPIGRIAAEKWLEHFAYRVELEGTLFLIAASILVAVSLLTVSFQAAKAIWAKPVTALRNE